MAFVIRRKIVNPNQLDMLEQPEQKGAFVTSRVVPVRFEKADQSTGIEWTNHTWNPFVGCNVHTAGCTNCYAMNQAANINAAHYKGVVKLVNGNAVWTGVLNQSPPHIIDKPRKIKEPSMIFVNSMSDFFHEKALFKWQMDAMHVMEQTPQHTYQILTKRPENIQNFERQYGKPFPDNVWVGATMERHDYRHRIDTIRAVHAKIKFLSIEPLVGPVHELDLHDIDWVILGGESGFGARIMKYEWVKEVVDQCVAQKVPLFFKQYGVPRSNPLWAEAEAKGLNPNKYVSENDPVGKGGSLVEGVAWKQFPNSV